MEITAKTVEPNHLTTPPELPRNDSDILQSEIGYVTQITPNNGSVASTVATANITSLPVITELSENSSLIYGVTNTSQDPWQNSGQDLYENLDDLQQKSNFSQQTVPVPFSVHVYGFTTLFISVDLFIVYVCITSRRRVITRPATVGILSLVAIFCCNFVILLVTDPYGFKEVLPRIIVTFIVYFKYLSFVIAFWLIQLVLKSLSSIKVVDPEVRLQRYRAFAFMCLAYACVMMTIAVITCEKPGLLVLHLIPQAIYVTSIIVLCFTFLYSALNISQYTKQTSRVLDETIIYSKMHTHLKQNGRYADASLDLYRVKRDKLALQADLSPDDIDNYYNLYHDPDSSSNDSFTFCNQVAMSDPAKIEEIFENRHGEAKRRHTNNKKCKQVAANKTFYSSQQYAILDSTTDCGFSSDETDNSQNSCGKNNAIIDHKRAFPVKLQMQKMSDMLQETGGQEKLRNKSNMHSCTTVFSNSAFNTDNHQGTSKEGYKANGVNDPIESGEEKISSAQSRKVRGSWGTAATSAKCNGHTVKETSIAFRDEKFEDNGYLADTENALGDEGKDIDGEDEDDDDGGAGGQKGERGDSPNRPPLSSSLPNRYCNYIGLQRVRKGRCVKKVMHTTYLTAIFAFLLCVLELYEMFSVKGLLTGLDSSGQYTWLLFQSFMRMSEVGFTTSVIRSIQILGKPRKTVHKKPVSDKHKVICDDVDERDSDTFNEQAVC